jgi:hypothetical protein
MSVQLSFRAEQDYLFVIGTGRWTTRDAQEAIDSIYVELERRKFTRLLVDVRELSKPDHEMTRFFTGDHWANVFGEPFKAAFIMLPDVYNGFGETVAVNRGAALKVFLNEVSAVEWLRS